ncbi:hypothetical protein ONZ45_g15406 [Pleurotus djamor]|nr:hypothetical protein ONZ45_g15406 [Pleurotus djamor]
MIQGGDFTKHNGTGGESIYGGMFDDEHLDRPVDAEGLLCMANRGPNTNGSQFFVTLRPCPHLSGKHVVFGRVLRGFEEVIKKIEQVPTDAKNRPTTPVTIVNCGELELRRKPDAASQKPNAVPLASESKEKKEKVKERRRKSRSRSPDSDDSRSRRKKHKPKKHREDTPPS